MKTFPNVFPNYYKNGEDFIEQHMYDHRGECNFFSADSEERYLKNLKTQPDDWYYRTKNVTYNINSLGYRTKEFDEIDWKNSIVIIGCSMTFGLGVSEDETYPYLLSLLTGKYVVNLGVIAASNQLLLDISLMLKKKYGPPYMLIMNWTSTARFPYYGTDGLKNIGVWSGDDENDIKYFHLFHNLYREKCHEIIAFKNIIDTFKNIWSDETKCYYVSFFYDTAYYGDTDLYFNPTKLARDFKHPSFLDYSYAAKKTHELIIGKKLII